jgi:hypothetical protein
VEDNLSAPNAQASFNRIVDDRAPSNGPPPFPPCLSGEAYEGDDGCSSSITDQAIVDAYHDGKKLIADMRRQFFAARRAHTPARKPILTRRTGDPARRARARRSPATRGGARKVADDSGSSGGSRKGDGEPRPYHRLKRSIVLEAVR